MLIEFFSKIYKKVLNVISWLLLPIGAFGGAVLGWLVATKASQTGGAIAAGLILGFVVGLLGTLLLEMLTMPLLDAVITIRDNTQALKDAIPPKETKPVKLPKTPTTEAMNKANSKEKERQTRLKKMRASTEGLDK